MPGVKGRSGRKPAAQEAGIAAAGEARPKLAEALGELGTTEVDIVAFMGRVQKAFLDGLCSLAEARELREAASSAARVIGRRAQARELEELRELLARAEELERAGQGNEAAERQQRSDADKRTPAAHRRDPREG